MNAQITSFMFLGVVFFCFVLRVQWEVRQTWRRRRKGEKMKIDVPALTSSIESWPGRRRGDQCVLSLTFLMR